MTILAPVMQGYLRQRLTQRRASPATVANHRDTFRLLLRFAAQRTGKPRPPWPWPISTPT